LKETFVFSRDNFSNHGVVTLVIDRDKVDIRGARAFGWIGIGKERIVTKSHNNVVYEIDGKPAVDFYVKYLDISPDEPIPPIGIEYPLEVTMKSGLVVYRAIMGVDEEKRALIFAGHSRRSRRLEYLHLGEIRLSTML